MDDSDYVDDSFIQYRERRDPQYSHEERRPLVFSAGTSSPSEGLKISRAFGELPSDLPVYNSRYGRSDLSDKQDTNLKRGKPISLLGKSLIL